ncbi:MAG TPA: ATP-binding cassette domain-containing protein, partial [Chromatiales bacterium]|nr:ATP-binding cassette domain-containing protein [Chromatiales bacterium]
MAETSFLIRAEGVMVERDGTRLLDGVGLSVAPRQIVTLVGPNGAGKTTLVRVLLGLM